MGTYAFFVTNLGVPATGLTPTWSMLKRLSDNANQAQPAITEVSNGFYKFSTDIPVDEHWVGLIDAGATLANSERYIPVDLIHKDLEGANKYLNITPIYDEDTDSLTFVIFLLEDGELKQADLTSIALSIYGEDHVLKFTLSGTSFTNGVAVVTKSTPGLTANEQYYVTGAIVTSDIGTITGAATFVVLE